jgi:hypothetical protein
MRGLWKSALYLTFVLSAGTAVGAAERIEKLPVQVADSSVGKSPVVAMMTEMPSENMNFWKEWMALNSALPFVISDTPPKSTGPGLHYDKQKYFYVYTDYHAPQNHFAASGWMGDYGDISIKDASLDDPADGKNCIKISYSAKGSQGAGWAGMYWQDPVDNWGSKYGGYDLSGVKRLTFWVKGAHGGEVVSEFKIGGIGGPFEDSGSARIGPVVLSDHWQQLAIDLSAVDMRHIIGGFAWSAAADQNRQGMTFYIDEIRYER